MISSRAAHSRRFAVVAAFGALMAVLGALFCVQGLASPSAAHAGAGHAPSSVSAGAATSVPDPAAASGASGMAEAASSVSASGPASAPGGFETAGDASPDSADEGTPGCERPEDQGTDPSPVRGAAAYDQCPTLVDDPAVAVGEALYTSHALTAVRGPTMAAPTPMELSVLRV
jgi:hypothetical protein